MADFRNKGNVRPGAPGAAHHETPGRGAVGSHDRATHEQATGAVKVRDAAAGELRAKANSVSGTYLVKHDPGAAPDNDHFWHVVVRGPEVMLNWGKVSTPGKSEVKHFPDGLAAEAWASESVAHKLTSGYAVREGEGAAAGMRQEGVPREPLEHGKAHRHAKHEE